MELMTAEEVEKTVLMHLDIMPYVLLDAPFRRTRSIHIDFREIMIDGRTDVLMEKEVSFIYGKRL